MFEIFDLNFYTDSEGIATKNKSLKPDRYRHSTQIEYTNNQNSFLIKTYKSVIITRHV